MGHSPNYRLQLTRKSGPALENYQMKKVIYSVLVILVTGCASNSGVVPIGPDTFMVSRQAATGFSGSGTLKAD